MYLLTNEYFRLVILCGMFTSFKSSLSKLLIRIFSLIFDLLWFYINSLCILFSKVIVELEKIVTVARCKILEFAKILKIVVFPSRVKLLILLIFKTVSFFCLWFLKFLCDTLIIKEIYLMMALERCHMVMEIFIELLLFDSKFVGSV